MAEDELPPVPALRAPVDADAFAKLEAVAARAAHAAVEGTSLLPVEYEERWSAAEYVEAEVRSAMREFAAPAPDPDAPEMPAPAQRPAMHVFGAVIEELDHAPMGTVAETAERVLKRLAREGMLTPGDVVLRDARQLGLGVLVDGKRVEPDRVHLVRPSAGESPEAVRERLRDVVRERAPELDVEGPIIGPMLDSFAEELAELRLKAWAGCKGCGRPVGRPHEADCGFARSRVVNQMQTRIAPVGTRAEAEETGDQRFATAVITREARLNRDPLEHVVKRLDRYVAGGRESVGENELIVVAVEGDARDAYERVIAALRGDGERRPPAAAGAAPDLVSRMIDARDCLRGCNSFASAQNARAIEGALRWLDVGIEEGLAQRELYGDLRRLLAGEPHICTCGETSEGAGDGCTVGFEDRCRFEAALRSLVGDA